MSAHDLSRGGAGSGAGSPVTYDLASWGVRAIALLIDSAILAIPLVIGIMTVESDPKEQQQLIRSLAYPIVLASLLYSIGLMVRRGARNGQTLGKQAMKIRVVRDDGAQVSLRTGMQREVLGRTLPALVTLGLYPLADYLWPLWDENRQCLHDKIASTRVVHVGATLPALAPAAEPQPSAPEPRGVPAAPPPPPPREEDDRPVRDGWLPPAAGG